MTPSTQRFDWASRHAALDDVAVSGDACLVRLADDGVLVAVIDGLGHGPGAQEATDLVLEALRGLTLPPVSLEVVFATSHQAAKSSRGVAMTAAWIDTSADTMSWSAVGNVEGVLVRASATASPRREGVLPRGGVVGYRLPSLRVKTLPLFPGDLLVIATDGIEAGFTRHPTLLDIDVEPRQIADSIFAEACKNTDDALVFVGRYRGR